MRNIKLKLDEFKSIFKKSHLCVSHLARNSLMTLSKILHVSISDNSSQDIKLLSLAKSDARVICFESLYKSINL